MGMLANIGEAAKALGVHPETLRRWEKEGKVPTPLRTLEARGVMTRISHPDPEVDTKLF